MESTISEVKNCAMKSNSRFDLWTKFINEFSVKNMAEIGVFKGVFAEKVLADCPLIEKYYMVDPWRHINNWNKPINANNDNQSFDTIFSEAIQKTEFASHKRIVLRGKTTEVIDEIPDSGIDLIYIDGDHTLKGISIDLIKAFSKVRDGGWIAGDDFSESIWQHPKNFEPTLIFPFAVYFAEAVDCPIYSLPHNQFLILKDPNLKYSFTDIAGGYGDTTLLNQFSYNNNT